MQLCGSHSEPDKPEVEETDCKVTLLAKQFFEYFRCHAPHDLGQASSNYRLNDGGGMLMG